MPEQTTPSGPDFEALADAYFDQVLAPALSILTERDQGKVYEVFMGCCEMSSAAKVGLNLWVAQSPPSRGEADRG